MKQDILMAIGFFLAGGFYTSAVGDISFSFSFTTSLAVVCFIVLAIAYITHEYLEKRFLEKSIKTEKETIQDE